MPNRLVFLATVVDVRSFDQKIETRRIMQNCGAKWNQDFNLTAVVTEVKCGPEFPCLNMFSLIFAEKDMVMVDAFDAHKAHKEERRIWGIFSTAANLGLMIVNHRVAKLAESHCDPTTVVLANKLYCLVFRPGQKPHLIDTTTLSSAQFQALVEEASAGIPSGR